MPRFAYLAAAMAFWSGICARGEETPKWVDLSPRPALHERIDQQIEAAAVGPLATTCSDADFIRRIYLDLTGVIPTAQQARDFVASPAADKRRQLIDDLLATSAFVRHMTVTFDVLLMERKPEKVIKQPEWEAYLFRSLAENKPLDQWLGEMISSDGADDKLRPAARFVLDRDAEPNLLTRDIGRLAFGMDLQCAQCHDHPLVDDYFQDDYYGLFAFVQRTSLFTDAKTKLVSLSEKADGEASFKSVFTGASSDKALPRWPKGELLLAEPIFAKGDEYQVKPDKAVRGVPKFSRRAALAENLSDSREFSRNMANRLWALMFGRGLVHPLDFHHAANPPSHPELLTLLADHLRESGYQWRPFLRELALTRAYNRSCDVPRPETLNFADIAARLEILRQDRDAAKSQLPALQSSLAAAKEAFKSSREEADNATAEVVKLQAAADNAKAEMDKLAAARRAGEAAIDKTKTQVTALCLAAGELEQLAGQIPHDAVVAQSAAVVATRVGEFEAALHAAAKSLQDQMVQDQAAIQRAADTQRALELAKASVPAIDQLRTAESAQLVAEHGLADARYCLKMLDLRIAAAEAMLAYRDLAAHDAVKAEAAWAAIVERWTIALQAAPLKPLAPEQMAASAMQATGVLAPQLAAAAAKLEKSPPDELKKAAAAESETVRTRLFELGVLSDLRGTVREFVRLYGGDVGQEFQATVNQALFFGNGTLVDGWLKPSGDNLAQRLSKEADVTRVADELYWAIFSRAATDAEKSSVSAYLRDRQTDNAVAIGELAWALLSSTEFRFNH